MPFKKRTIEVSQEVIDGAVRGNSNHCAVQVALQQAYSDATHIQVDNHFIRMTFKNEGKRYLWLTPGTVQKYVYDFDMEKPIHPFKFKLHTAAYIVDASPRGQGDKLPRTGTAKVRVRGNKEGATKQQEKTTVVIPDAPIPRAAPRSLRTKGLRNIKGAKINPQYTP